MSTARLREALNAGAPGNSKEKGPPVADGILSVTPDTPEAAEWRTRRSAIDFPSSSSSYLEDEEEDNGCNKPSDLYGKFTWKIDNFSEINKRELRSNVFEVGSYKWYILVYPQGCDVCNHLSLFLCVADYDKLLPGWSHFAQFTIAVVNKDPKKSKYSDTLHRFCKKEHDWGWKKFMELSKVLDGFTVADTLVIKAQVQVIKDRISRPFRCLDPQYRRELVRVYLTNVEGICRRFVEERRDKLGMLRETPEEFKSFWLELSAWEKGKLAQEKSDLVLKGIVKRFFNEKEVTSTLVMDAIYSGCCAMEEQTRQWIFRETAKDTDLQKAVEPPPVHLDGSKGVFSLGENVLQALERAANESIPAFRDDKCSDGSCVRSHGDDDYGKDSVDRDERRLAELGRRTVEMFVLTHVYTEILEVSYREAESLKRQEALIREEEELERIEGERHQARQAAEKERRNRKKERKEKAKKARRDQEDEEKRKIADIARLAEEDKARKAKSQQALNLLQPDVSRNEHSLACEDAVAVESDVDNDTPPSPVEYPIYAVQPLGQSLLRSASIGKEQWNMEVSEMGSDDNGIESKIVAVLEKKVQDMEIQLFQKDQNIYMLQSQLAEATGSGDGSTGNLFGEFSFMAFEKDVAGGYIEEKEGTTVDFQPIATTMHEIHAQLHSNIADASQVMDPVVPIHPQQVAGATISQQYSSNALSASSLGNVKISGNCEISHVNLGSGVSYRNVTLGQTEDCVPIGTQGTLQQGLASGGLRLAAVDAHRISSKAERPLHYPGLYGRIPCQSLPCYDSPNKTGFPGNGHGGESPGLEEFAHIGLINDLLRDH